VRLDRQKIRALCAERNLRLKDLLRRARVSRTAFYSLARKESVLPKSVTALARTLEISPADLLEDTEARVQEIRSLQAKLESLVRRHPDLDRDHAWHTLLSLTDEPITRLRRALTRGREFDFRR
jgi:transcriptional regulator with XRE-family HTH domain